MASIPEQSSCNEPHRAPELNNPAKITHVADDKEDSVARNPVMQCHLPPHPHGLSFPSYEAYEVHYQQNHVHRCTECHKNFPSDHYLNLHIAENHDPLNDARREKGDKTVGDGPYL
jgi:hypothetical protein